MPVILLAVSKSGVMPTVLNLVEKHPWNNMVQLKAHLIFEDMFVSEIEKTEKADFLKSSEVTTVLVRMATVSEVKFATGNLIRNGYMGFVIKLANLIEKNQSNMTWNDENSDALTEEWREFVSNELENSNERNSRNLGGRPTSNHSEDDETNQFDVNMDNIMKRFKCFNTIMQNNSSTDDDDKEDEDDVMEEPEGEGDNEGDGSDSAPAAETEAPPCEVTLPKPHEVDSKFANSSYWKIENTEDELDAMLADYE